MGADISSTIKKVLVSESVSDEGNVRAATEQYQKEFPYERDEEAQVTRREFCNFLGLTSAALFLGGAAFAGKAFYEKQQTPVFVPMKIEGGDSLEANTALNFHYPTDKDSAILIRTADGAYHAYGQKCTHLACPVYYERQHMRLECPCHEGAFDVMSGNVLYGPPPRPLDVIKLENRNGELWAVERKPAGGERAI